MNNDWSPTFWSLDRYELSKESRDKIIALLNKDAIPAVESAITFYLSVLKNEEERPSIREDRKIVDEIHSQAKHLRELLDSTGPSVKEYIKYRLMAENNIPYGLLDINTHMTQLACLEQATRDFAGTRKPKRAKIILCYRLAEIWKNTHGTWPRRSVNNYNEVHGGESGPMIDLLEIVFSEIHPGKPLPTGTLRDLDLWIKSEEKRNGNKEF